MIVTHLTNGFGNNLFQYIAGKLLATHHEQELAIIPPSYDYYGIENLKDLGLDFKDFKHEPAQQTIFVNESNYKLCYNKKYKDYNFELKGYFEDYTFYKENIDIIKSWFPEINKHQSNDLVIHFRAGDRLFYKNEFDYKPSVENYIDAIQQFDFENLHIVTDMPNWDYISAEDLESIKFHVDVPTQDRVPIEKSVSYFNSCIEGLSKFNPIYKKRNVHEDFNFIRSFDKIILVHGTLAWWAAVLSDAKKVGVYGPWRAWKGASNKNLSNVNIEGWFKWA